MDTGASSTLMSLNTFKQFWPEKKLQRCDTRLRTYAGEIVPIVGKANVTVEYKGQQATLPLLVVEILGPTLLGRNWLSRIRLHWPSLVCRITEDKAQLDTSYKSTTKCLPKNWENWWSTKPKFMWMPTLHQSSSKHVLFCMP